MSTGRKCDGYDIAQDNPKALSDQSNFPHGFGSIPIHSSSSLASLDLTNAESVSFDFFRTRTASEISGVFDPTLWNRLILQVSHEEPSILHGAIALGSMHRSLTINGSVAKKMADGLSDQHQLLGLQQYTKSIGQLKDRLNSPKSPRLIEVVLMNVALFVSLELLMGHQRNAIAHLKSGHKILSESQVRKHDQSQEGSLLLLDPEPCSVEEYLVEFFARLDVQSAIFGEQSPSIVRVPQRSTAEYELRIPNSFSNFTEARQYQDTLTSAIFRLRSQSLNNVLFICHGQLMDSRIRSSLSDAAKSARRKELEQRLSEWRRAFNNLIKEPKQLLGSKEARAAVLLQMHHNTISLLASASLFDAEMDYDEHLSDFQKIVDLATDYMKEEKSKLPRPAISSVPTFTIDMGIIGPLYLIGHKCRDPRIRRDAVSLLRRSAMHREGMWDSTAADFVARIIAIEEAEAGLEGKATMAEEIPESARLYDAILDRSQDYKRGVIIRGRFRHQVDGEWYIREEIFDF